MALFNIFKCLLHLFIYLVCAYMHVYMCACVYGVYKHGTHV